MEVGGDVERRVLLVEEMEFGVATEAGWDSRDEGEEV